MQHCSMLKEYAQYVAKVRHYAAYMQLNQAVERAVNECIREGILTEFLIRNRSEVINMSIFEYDKELEEKKLRKAEFEAGREIGHEAGLAEGKNQAAFETAKRMLALKSGEVKKGEPERLKVKTLGVDGFMLGKQNVDLRYIEQLIDSEQTAALGLLLKYTVEHLVDGKRTISETAQWLEQKLEQEGMVFAAEHGVISGGYAIPRIQEIYSCLNRYRV